MALYARSMELCGITHSGNAAEDTSNLRYDASYGIRVSAIVNINNAAAWLGVDNIDGGPYAGTFWHRFWFSVSGGANLAAGRTLMEYSDNAGTPVFRLQITGANTIQAQYWSGAAWVAIGLTWSAIVAGGRYKCDLKIVAGASFEFYATNNTAIDPPLVLSGAASMAAVTNIYRIRHYSCAASPASTAEWIWGDESTVGQRYAWTPPTGDGTYTAGSGTFADVDEAVTSDADVSTLAANGDAETYTHSAMTLPATGTVKAVQIEARVRNTAGGAQNVKARLRVGGANYDDAANFAGIGGTFGPYVKRWATNPAGGAWTLATASQTGNEFGAVGQT